MMITLQHTAKLLQNQFLTAYVKCHNELEITRRLVKKCATFTHADHSRGSEAFIGVCMCVCVSFYL